MRSPTLEREGASSRIVRPEITKVMVSVTMLLFAARVEAFGVAGVAGVRVSHSARQLSSCAAAAPAVLRPEDGPAFSEATRALREQDSRGFFERMGKPRYIAAPMVEHSEAVSVVMVVYLSCDAITRACRVGACQQQQYEYCCSSIGYSSRQSTEQYQVFDTPTIRTS